MCAMILDAVRVNALVMPSLDQAKKKLSEISKYGSQIASALPTKSNGNTRTIGVQETMLKDKARSLGQRLGVISNNVTTIKTKLDAKLDKAKLIEKKNKARTTGLAAAAGAVAGVAGAVAGAVTGGVKGAVVGGAVAAAGAVVATKVVTSVGKAIKNTCATVAKSVGNFFSSVWNGIKDIGKKIWDACKKIANKVVSFVKEKIAPVLKKIMNGVWAGIKFLGRCAATVVNLAISLVEGIVSFVEAIGDVVLLVVGGVCSVVTALADIVRGVCTGEWDWKCTSAVWKKWIMPWVGYDWTSKAFSWNSNSFIDKAAFGWAKRDGGIGYKIGKGVGYVVGIALATAATAGIAGAATSAGSAAGTVAAKTAGSIGAKVATTLANKTITSTILAGVGKMGKATASGYNDVIDSQVESYYISQLKLQNPSLSKKELEELFKQCKKAGVFTDYDKVRKSCMDNISAGKIAGVLGSAAVQGGIEAATWYITYGKGGENLYGKGFGLDKLGHILKSKTQWIKPTTKVGKLFLNNIGPATVTKAGIQGLKEYGNELATMLYDGEMDWETATSSAIVSGTVSILYDNTASEWMKQGLKKLSSETAASTVTNTDLDAGASEVSETFLKRIGNSFKNISIKFGDKIKPGVKKLLEESQTADGKKAVGKAIKDLMKDDIKDEIKDGVGAVFDLFSPERAGA